MSSGYDKYLEFQFGWSGDFYTCLFRAIQQADSRNLSCLAEGFPEEVEAYKTWAYVGQAAFLSRVSPDHSLLAKIKSGEAVL